ncbi:hypothetical protein [Butyrivibrio sp. Su6]|uniref:hypothetical protein n=1 Tax=Butyrivibrio sp. Su6 TaxID=1520810 RepID=UPI0011B07745|nr:hypothetical protein [Butyrivibrio sp. Su6]
METITKVIDEQVQNERKTYDVKTYQYDNSICFSRADFRRNGLKKFEITLKEPVTAGIGIDRSYMPGENGIIIYVDGNLVYDESFEWNYGFGQEHVDKVVEEPVYIEKKIVVEFSSIELAKYFNGIMLNY